MARAAPLFLSVWVVAVAMATAASPPPLRLNGWYPCAATRNDVFFSSSPDFECAKVELPLCHEGVCESTKTTEVFVKRKLATGTVDPQVKKAVWFLEGGPGASSVNMEEAMLLQYALLNESVSVYTMDHRGTGRSGYLQCEAAQAMADGSPGGSDLQLSELADCVRDVLFEIDGHTAAYSVSSAAHDVVVLLDFLQDPEDDEPEQIYLYGVSYGTYLVERVMHLAKPGQIKGFMLDGVVAESGFYAFDWNHNILTPSTRFFEACFDSPDCPLQFKSRDTVLDEVLEMYDDIDTAVANSSCASALSLLMDDPAPSTSLRIILGLLARDPWSRAYVPSLLVRLHRCSEKDFAALNVAMPFLKDKLTSIYGGMSMPTHQAWPFQWTHTNQRRHGKPRRDAVERWRVDPIRTPSTLLYYLIAFSELWRSPLPDLDTLQQQFLDGPFSADIAILPSFCMVSGSFNTGNSEHEVCNQVRQALEEAGGELDLPVVKTPFLYKHDAFWNKSASLSADSSVLLISGGLDFQTPSQFGQQQFDAIDADNKLLVEFEFGGHGSGFQPTSPTDFTSCGPNVIASFIANDGDVEKVDTSCVETLPPLHLDDTPFLELVGQLALLMNAGGE